MLTQRILATADKEKGNFIQLKIGIFNLQFDTDKLQSMMRELEKNRSATNWRWLNSVQYHGALLKGRLDLKIDRDQMSTVINYPERNQDDNNYLPSWKWWYFRPWQAMDALAGGNPYLFYRAVTTSHLVKPPKVRLRL